ncbi:MAG: SpoIIE family protein phosphatase [Armatimonadetes bacterium]|nr:SpoIIE family protein phosphatase [Armatimonadota bacterium]
MLKNMRIGTKLLLSFFFITAILVLVVGYRGYETARNNLNSQITDSLTLVTEAKEGHLVSFLENAKRRAVDFASDGFVRDSVWNVLKGDKDAAVSLTRHLARNVITLDPTLCGIHIATLRGRIIASTSTRDIGGGESLDGYFREARRLPYGSAHLSDVFFCHYFGTKAPVISVSAPIMDKNTGKRLGVLINYVKMNQLNDLLSGKQQMVLGTLSGEKGKPDTLEMYLVNQDGFLITESRHSAAVLRQRVDTVPVRKCRTGVEMTGRYVNFMGVPVIGASMCLGNGWTLLAEIDEKEAMAGMETLKKQAISSTIPVVFVILVLVYFLIREIVKPVQDLTGAARKIGDGDLSQKVKIVSGDEIGCLGALFNEMSDKLQASRAALEERTGELSRTVEAIGKLNEELMRRQGFLDFQLDLANKIQTSILPNDYESGEVSIHARLCQASEVGGDFFQITEMDGNRVAFFVGDVMGKGIAAALVMTMMMSILPKLVLQLKCPADVLKSANRDLFERLGSDPMAFVTVLAGILDKTTGKLLCASAGHEEGVVLSSSGETRAISPDGMVLGVIPDPAYTVQEFFLTGSDKVVVYTDGITDMQNAGGDRFGEERFMASLLKARQSPSIVLINQILADAAVFLKEEKLADDIALLALEMAPHFVGKTHPHEGPSAALHELQGQIARR